MNAISSSLRDGFLGIKALLKGLVESCVDSAALHDRVNTSPGIPVSDPSTSFWLRNPPFPDIVDMRSDTLPKTADIVIIGSGITGASIARQILTECAIMGIEKRVVMLEARQVCSGATGRNGGHIKCTPYESFSQYKKRFGPERARALVSFQTSHLKILVDLAKQENWDKAEVREVETVDFVMDEHKWIETLGMVEELRQGMPDEAQATFIWEKDAAREKYQAGRHTHGAITYQAGALWPYRLVTSVLHSLLRSYPSNFSIETHTPVQCISIVENPDQPFLIHTPRGDIAATHVVHATNAHTAHLVPGFRGKLFPVRGLMTAQRPGKNLHKLNGLRSWCFINRKGYEYIIQRPGEVDSIDGMGGEVMAGGGMARTADRGLDEIGIASDAETNYLAGCHMAGVLPMAFGPENWGEDSPGGRMKDMWSGSIGLTADMMPFVGRLEPSLTGRTPPKLTQSTGAAGMVILPAEWVSAGYNGEGMVNAWLCGVALGLMILGREDISTVKAPGRPHGRVRDWFPKEYICSQERVTKASLSQLLDTR